MDAKQEGFGDLGPQLRFVSSPPPSTIQGMLSGVGSLGQGLPVGLLASAVSTHAHDIPNLCELSVIVGYSNNELHLDIVDSDS